MIITKISLFFSSITEFEVLKLVFFSLVGLTVTSTYSVYNALCPVWNTGCEITAPIFWGQARFQSFGVIATLLGWIEFWVYLCFGSKLTVLCAISFFLVLIIIFVFQMLAGIWKRYVMNKDNDINI